MGDAVRIEVDHLTDPLASPLVLTDSDWMSYKITSDMMSMADSFEVELRPSGDLLKWFRRPGHRIRVYLDGALRLKGIVESAPINTDSDGLTLSLAGRDYGLFLVDNAAPATTFNTTTMAQIVSALLSPISAWITQVELDPAANRYRVTGQKGLTGKRSKLYRGITSERSYEWRTKAGDKIGQRIEWLSEQIGCTTWLSADSTLIIAVPDYEQTPLYQPLYVHVDSYGNVTGSNCTIKHSGDIGERHARIALVGQGTDAASAIGIDVAEKFAAAIDPSESFYYKDSQTLQTRLPKTDVIVYQGVAGQNAVRRAARTRLEDRVVKSAEISIMVDGHRQDASTPLWAPDTVVPVDFQPRAISAPYYIRSTTLHGGADWRSTEITAIPCNIWLAVDHDSMGDSAYLSWLLPLWEQYAL